jgi:hypothetical protein
MHETRMSTTSLCRSVFLRLLLFSLNLGNGMEEVVGSIPTRSTKSASTFRLLFSFDSHPPPLGGGWGCGVFC